VRNADTLSEAKGGVKKAIFRSRPIFQYARFRDLRFQDEQYTREQDRRITSPMCQETGYEQRLNLNGGLGQAFPMHTTRPSSILVYGLTSIPIRSELYAERKSG
jgi:hypothetical protein